VKLSTHHGVLLHALRRALLSGTLHILGRNVYET
jgi:hypothetical protein